MCESYGDGEGDAAVEGVVRVFCVAGGGDFDAEGWGCVDEEGGGEG